MSGKFPSLAGLRVYGTTRLAPWSSKPKKKKPTGPDATTPQGLEEAPEELLEALRRGRLPAEHTPRIKKMIAKYESSLSMELQQRACEYKELLAPSGGRRRAPFQKDMDNEGKGRMREGGFHLDKIDP